jgi:hypothetical protein
VPCFALAGTHKKEGFWFWQGANRSDTGWYGEDWQHGQGQKTLFYVPDRVKHCTRFKDDLQHPRVSVVVRIGMGRKASFCSQ